MGGIQSNEQPTDALHENPIALVKLDDPTNLMTEAALQAQVAGGRRSSIGNDASVERQCPFFSGRAPPLVPGKAHFAPKKDWEQRRTPAPCARFGEAMPFTAVLGTYFRGVMMQSEHIPNEVPVAVNNVMEVFLNMALSNYYGSLVGWHCNFQLVACPGRHKAFQLARSIWSAIAIGFQVGRKIGTWCTIERNFPSTGSMRPMLSVSRLAFPRAM